MTEDELRDLAASMGFYLLRRAGGNTAPIVTRHKRTRDELCKHGHSLADAFEYEGTLQCRTCSRDRVRAIHARSRAYRRDHPE